MPPKARARAARVSASARAVADRAATRAVRADRNAVMEALMQTIVDRGTLP